MTKGIGVSVGINTDGKSNDNGGISGVSLTYNDSKEEGVTRATIGEGTVTVGGDEDDKGINRDINKAQEVLIDEGMEVTVNVPIELITDPEKYFTKMGEIMKDPKKAKIVQQIIAATKAANYKKMMMYGEFAKEGEKIDKRTDLPVDPLSHQKAAESAGNEIGDPDIAAAVRTMSEFLYQFPMYSYQDIESLLTTGEHGQYQPYMFSEENGGILDSINDIENTVNGASGNFQHLDTKDRQLQFQHDFEKFLNNGWQ